MRAGFRFAALWLWALVCTFAGAIAPAHAELGRTVTNTVTLTYQSGGQTTTIVPEPAAFMVEARRTPSTIEFFRFAPNAPDGVPTQINGADYAPGGATDGPFIAMPAPVNPGGQVIDVSGEVPLVPAERYFSGEVMFVRVSDPGQNGDPDVIETVVITLTSASGDSITLRLYESGPDTGAFYAWVPSTPAATPVNDPAITAPDQAKLTATYIDPFDTREVTVDTALVDPFGRVFDALSGELLAGVSVSVVDAQTGEPAPVFGVDGVSRYPSTVLTGSTVTDESGFAYVLEPGQFLFPLMPPGRYRLVIESPAAYVFPSLATDFERLQNAPFTISAASYGGVLEIDGSGPLTFDVPLDPQAALIVRKEALSGPVAVGDFVPYGVTVENRDVVPARVLLRDDLPNGFRFQSGSVRRDGEPAADPVIAADGTGLTFDLGVLAPGASLRLEYVAAVTAGAPAGEAVNRIVAVDGGGNPVSNAASAAVRVEEEFLSSRLTIVGRIAEAGCEADDAWARELKDGIGVAGVRLYLEDGSYTVTDANGLYHFEGVRPGTHVVQVDTETLPPGYSPMICEENTRYAGSATSKFVDSPGGVIWRANFYLQRTGEVAEAAPAAEFNDATEHLAYDQAWLDAQEGPAAEWVYPDPSRTPSSPSVDIGVKHAPDLSVELWLNGKPVPGLNAAGRDTSADGSVILSRWRGVDIADGFNRFEARLKAADGSVRETLVRDIWYVTEATRATQIADQSVLVADGRTVPEIAVRIEDDAGRPVHPGRILQVDVEDPYRLFEVNAVEAAAAVTRSLAGNGGVAVGADGIARIRLAPTLEAGRVSVRITLDDGKVKHLFAWLSPETRDWIVVGLAEGMVGLDGLSGDGAVALGDDGSDVFTDGRVAFYAKGLVKGDWLLTLAVDTDRRRGARDGEFRSEIDPDAYYTLYGDRTYQGQDAVSRYPVFVKLEKKQAQFLFGDFPTGLNETTLARYQRRLTGLKMVYEGERFSVVGFAAETNQGFVRETLAADGTSGPYRLPQAPVIAQSETVTLEIRDRFRPDIVLETRSLIRYLDYDLDDRTGEIIFSAPVEATDADFNPQVIVVDYEAEADAERNLTAGGRAAVRTVDGRLEAGVTLVQEGGSARVAGAENQLGGIDVTARLGERSEVRAEYARTLSKAGGQSAIAGEAVLIEAVHQSEIISLNAFYREDGVGFGLGQQSEATANIRRYGVAANVRLGETDDAETSLRTTSSVSLEAYREENLTTGTDRTVAQAIWQRDNQILSLDAGLRYVEETFGGDQTRRSVLLAGGFRRTFAEQGMTLIGRHEQPLSGDNESSLFPQRTLIGLDKRLTEWATLNVRHEIVDGDNASGQNTLLGVTLRPWTGAEVRAQTDRMTNEAGQRLGATLGIDQSIRIDDRWMVSLGGVKRARIGGDDAVDAVVPGDAVGPLSLAPLSDLTGTEGYTALYAGVGYREAARAVSARVEMRDSTLGERYAGILSGAQDVTHELTFAGSARYTYENLVADADRRTTDIRLGLARRPRGEGLIVFDRLDIRSEDIDGVSRSWKAINNLAVNAMLGDATQASAYWGVKYARATINGADYESWTQLFGGQLRHDLSPRWDVGLTGSVLWSMESNNAAFAFGPVIGFKPHENVWLIVGYNLEGFVDEDFAASEYTRQGLWLKVRAKFDQDTLREVLDWISPDGK